MKGDFTRDTFDPVKQFSRVLMQQGRVQLDADWNEQNAILLHYLRTLAADILGPHAGPPGSMGFSLITEGTVKGWIENGLDPEAEWTKIEPDETRRAVLRNGVEQGEDAAIVPGRYYVDGILVENPSAILYTEQLGYPFTPETELSNLREKELLVYLDVWERHITYVQDDSIREVALGGADTCSRAQVIWQVKALLRGDLSDFNCESAAVLGVRDPRPKLRARAKRGEVPPGLCTAAPEARYLGLENQLYRVEIHEVLQEGGRVSATYKWSRDNGSVVFPIISLSGTTVTLSELGRDLCNALKSGDWVEVCDEELALREQSGPLAQVEAVDREELSVTLRWPDGVTDTPNYTTDEIGDKHPLLRRWDHMGDLADLHGALQVSESATVGSGWLDLEDGVQIWFAEGGDYRAGDYWLIPARIATGDVEWPQVLEADAEVQPKARSPHGPSHHFAPLYWVGHDGMEGDCRCTIQQVRLCGQ
jgi:hypothetical protein